MMKELAFAFATAVAALSCSLSVAQADTINVPSNGGTLQYWGPSSTGNLSFGQYFTAPQPTLENYSLTVRAFVANFDFVSQIYAWNGTGAYGPALFTSSLQTTTFGFSTYTWNPGVTLIAGGDYIAIVTNQPEGVGLGGSGLGQIQTGTASTGLAFAEGAPANAQWYCQGICRSAQFRAEFSAGSAAVPEPTGWALMITGVGLAGAALRRRPLVAG